MRHAGSHLVPPAREDIIRHVMRLTWLDMLGNRLRLRQPDGRGGFTDVVMLFRAKEGAQIHRELVAATVVIGNGLNAYFMGGAVDFNCVENLGGIEQGVEHVASMPGPTMHGEMNLRADFGEGLTARATLKSGHALFDLPFCPHFARRCG